MAHANASLAPTKHRTYTRQDLSSMTPEEQKESDESYARYLDFKVAQEVSTGGQFANSDYAFFLDHEKTQGKFCIDPEIKEQHARYKSLVKELQAGGTCFGYQSDDAMLKESVPFSYCTLSFPEFIEFERKYEKKCTLLSWVKSKEYLEKERESSVQIV